MSNAFLSRCNDVIGADHVITGADMAGYLTDWRGRYTGNALAVLKPANTKEVAECVKLCLETKTPIVPQGGNTGLVLGSVPDQTGLAVVLSLSRLNQIQAIDTQNNTITVGAGCLLQQVQEYAASHQRLFPLSLAAEGSCTIGGNLSTNAGGTAVLRYGNMRELSLGLEVVTASGEIWNGLRGLRKDNTGYDLRQLFIGAEGTLGIITAAVLKLYAQPRAQLTAMFALESAEHAVALLSIAQEQCGASLTGFELMSDFCLQLVEKHFKNLSLPFAQRHPHYVLLELSDSESEQHAINSLEALVNSATKKNIILDAVLASSLAQSKTMWNLREHISQAQATEGKNIKHDIALPVSHIPQFITETDAALQKAYAGCRMVTFGHLGDGNLHYNVSAPEGQSDEIFLKNQAAINLIVHDHVHKYNGSISAEHGLGALKRDEIKRYKSSTEMLMMSAIKHALDPHNLMNPGKIL